MICLKPSKKKIIQIIISEIFIITVPTPINADNKPDISFVESAFDKVFKQITPKSGSILVLESTVYPGVTREVVSRFSTREGLSYPEDFVFAYCPERIDPGVGNRPISSIHRVVGCDDSDTAQLLVSLYSQISAGADFVGPPEVAEAAKLIENVQRDVDIALTNELAIVLSNHGLDAEEVFSAASTKWNFHRHKPGIGVGGHCIAVDPYYYLNLFEGQDILSESIVRVSRHTNNKMPQISKEQLVRDFSLSEEDKILVLGYSYKPNVGDPRNTPVKPLITALSSLKIECEIFEPLFYQESTEAVWHTEERTLASDYSAIIVATPHEIFDLTPNNLEQFCPRKRIFDGRRVLEKKTFIQQGWHFSAIGLEN